jgi:hypothetical protein
MVLIKSVALDGMFGGVRGAPLSGYPARYSLFLSLSFKLGAPSSSYFILGSASTLAAWQLSLGESRIS